MYNANIYTEFMISHNYGILFLIAPKKPGKFKLINLNNIYIIK